jgi:ice-binding like protein
MHTAWSLMNGSAGRRARIRPRPLLMLALGTATAMCVAGGVGLPDASAAITPTVQLGAATAFAVLAHSTITNTGTGTTVSGDVGLSPGTTIAAFPPGQIINGTKHDDDAVAGDAQTALTAAYLDAAGRTPFTTTSATLAGETLPAGVYKASSSLGLVGTVTLNGHGNPTAVFIFQVGSTLTTHSSSTVALVGTAQACNVFWQVTSSATLGTTSTFVGTVMALASVTLTSGVHVAGRVLARTGAVTLITDVITKPACITPLATSTSTTTTTAPPATTTPTTGTTASGGSGTGSGGSTGSGAASTGTGASTGATTTGAGAVGSTGSGGGTSAAGTTAGTVVPTGAPETGAGGASWSGDDPLLVGGGVLALIGAAGAAVLAVRRRRSPADRAKNGADPGA